MKRVLRDVVTFSRYVISQDDFGGNTISSTTNLGTFRCHLVHEGGNIEQVEALERQLITDFTFYFRKKSVSDIQKGDIAQLETPNVQVKINSIVEHDLNTIKMTGSTVD